MSAVKHPAASASRAGAHITSRDVAAMAGVSQSAVSRCFTPGASIAEETRQRVMRVAAELGYRPNVHARNLITGRTRIVGVVLAHLDNLFYPRFLQLLTERLQTQGMQVLMFVADGSREDELMAQLLNYRVDGIVLAATTLNAELARACTAAGIPVVLFNRVPAHAGDKAFHSVQTDQAAGMHSLTRLLLDNGHRRIAYLAGSLESSTNQARETGCRQALSPSGTALFAYGVGDYDPVKAREVVRGWYLDGLRPRARIQCPDAIVVADDSMALAVLDTLRHELGLRVPQDVSVVGFDDVPQAAWPSYDLTTYAQPLPEMIDAVLRLLTSQIETRTRSGKPARQGQSLVLAGEMRIRSTVRMQSG